MSDKRNLKWSRCVPDRTDNRERLSPIVRVAYSRAYVAAARRTDRPIASRVESALQASSCHYQRTRCVLYITEEIVLGDALFEELEEPEQFLDPNLRLPPGITLEMLLQDNPGLLPTYMWHHMPQPPPLLRMNEPVRAPVLHFTGNTQFMTNNDMMRGGIPSHVSHNLGMANGQPFREENELFPALPGTALAADNLALDYTNQHHSIEQGSFQPMPGPTHTEDLARDSIPEDDDDFVRQWLASMESNTYEDPKVLEDDVVE